MMIASAPFASAQPLIEPRVAASRRQALHEACLSASLSAAFLTMEREAGNRTKGTTRDTAGSSKRGCGFILTGPGQNGQTYLRAIYRTVVFRRKKSYAVYDSTV